jgi:hypothetical protein
VEKCGVARQTTANSITRRMRFAYWIAQSTDVPSEYVIFIAFPRQQWLRECVSVLRYKYIACLVILSVIASQIGPRLPRFLRFLDHTQSVSHSAALLRTSNQLVAHAAVYTAHDKPKRRTSIPSAEFEPAIPSNRVAAGLRLIPHDHRHPQHL